MRGTTTTRGRLAICAAALGLVLVAPTGPAEAEHDNGYGEHPTFDRSPGRGPQGTVIKLWGTGCIYRGTPWERARVYLFEQPSAPGKYSTHSDDFPIKDDGSWEGELVVPTEAPQGNYKLSAECSASDMLLQAGEQPFTVAHTAPSTTTAPPPTTTTTTTAPHARPAGATTTTTTTASTATTTDTTQPTSGPTHNGPEAAAPAASVSDDEDMGGGPPWGLAALVGAMATGGASVVAVRRRRRTTAGEAGASA